VSEYERTSTIVLRDEDVTLSLAEICRSCDVPAEIRNL
jgi:hypothetical protein